MATLAQQDKLTFSEVLRRHAAGMSMLPTANVIESSTPLFADAIWMEANEKLSHIFGQVVKYATAERRAINKGVGTGISQRAKFAEGITMFALYGEVDELLVNMSNDPAAFLADEGAVVAQGIGEQMEDAILYDNAAADPNQIVGISPRMPKHRGATTGKPDTVYSCGAGAASDATSCYIIQWGADRVHMVYPKGSPAGLKREERGKVDIQLTDGTKYPGYRSYYELSAGLVVRNPRCIARVSNVETLPSSDAPITFDALVTAMNAMYKGGEGSVIYAPQRVITKLQLLATAPGTTNLYVDWQSLGGRKVLTFNGSPVRLAERIVYTEALTTAYD